MGMARCDASQKLISKFACYALRYFACGRTRPLFCRKYQCDRFGIPTRLKQPAHASRDDLVALFVEGKNDQVYDLVVLERLQPFVPIDGKIVLYTFEVVAKVDREIGCLEQPVDRE